jgi:acyl-CoA dehydrogenase
MIKRGIFSDEHELFRDSVRKFVERELVPHHARWEELGIVDREAWLKAGAAGILCCDVAEQYGGAGANFLFNAVVIEELARAGMTGPGFTVHSDMVATYLWAMCANSHSRL